VEDIRARCTEEIPAAIHYQRLAARGLDFGPSLHGVGHIGRRDGEALARVELPAGAPSPTAYTFHPALLDACLQALAAALPDRGEQEAYLPFSLDSFTLAGRPGTTLWSHVRLHTPNGRAMTGDITLLNQDGQVIAELQGLHLRRAGKQQTGGEFDNWLYEFVWQEQQPAGEIATAVMAATTEHFAPLSMEEGLAAHNDLLVVLDQLATAYIQQAFVDLGWRPEPGQLVQAETLAAQLGIAEQHRRLFQRLLHILAEEGILEATAGGWRVHHIPPPADPQHHLQTLLAHCPPTQPQLVLTQRCGGQLAALLTGRADPLQILFPGGSLEQVDELYRHTPEARTFNRLAQRAVTELVNRLPADRRLRILEIGAGSGGTTSYLLPTLPAERTDCLCTDIAPLLVNKASERFRDYPFLRAQVLDIEQDPAGQGLAGEQFDLVLAVNVLHATADLRQSLAHARQLLAPGGLLLIMEETEPKRWIDITFGLTAGWWRFSDTAVRPAYPLITRQQWQALRVESGFEEPAIIPAADTASTHALILARVAATRPVSNWLILADKQGVGAAVAEQLRAIGDYCLLVSAGDSYERLGAEHWQLDPTRPAHFRQLLAEVVALAGQGTGEENGWARPVSAVPAAWGILHLWSLDVPPPPEVDSTSLDPGQALATGSMLHLVQALGSQSELDARLWLVTRGAQPAGEAGDLPLQVVQSPLWGLAKVIELEHPEWPCVRLDLDASVDPAMQAQPLLDALAAGDGETQMALRQQRRYVPRLAPFAQPTPSAGKQERDALPVRLVTAGSGLFDDIRLEAAGRRPPGPGEVEIQVAATGLNFRDVLNALAMRKDSDPLGSECGGVITAVGEGVELLAVGDEVMAVAPGSFATFVTTDASLVVRKPAHLTFAEVATFPMAFLTAHYALNHQAKIRAGERVLIHAAGGGVGLAAVQLAQRAGAEIFATAGSPERRAVRR